MTDNRIFWAAALTIGVIVVALVIAWAVRSMGSAARRRIGEYREAYEPLFADLWSNEMHRRLSALFVAQRIARSSDLTMITPIVSAAAQIILLSVIAFYNPLAAVAGDNEVLTFEASVRNASFS